MKKKEKITITQFVKSAPDYLEFIKEKNIPENFKELSFLEKIKHLGRSTDKYIILKNETGLFFIHDITRVTRCGKQIWTKHICCKAYIAGTSLKSTLQYAEVCVFFDMLGIKPFLNTSSLQHFLTKPLIIKAVLTGKIYNEETLCKYIIKMYKLGNVEWRVLRDFLDRRSVYFPLFDLRDFTKNLNNSLKKILTFNEGSYNEQSLYKDLLSSAVKLNQIVDFNWSEKRIREEHKKQTIILMEKELSSKESIPIYKNVIESPTIKLLNTELDIFREAKIMHHCLYNCYYQRIKNKNYMAFHMTSPEDCTFGIKLNADGILVLDQIYLAYDCNVSDETKQKALEFISNNSKELTFTLMFNKPNKEESTIDPFFIPNIFN